MTVLRLTLGRRNSRLALLIQHQAEIRHLDEGTLRFERSTAVAGLEYPIGIASDGDETVCRAARRLWDIDGHSAVLLSAIAGCGRFMDH